MFGAPAGHAALGLPPGTTAGALRAASLPMPGAWGTMEQLCYAAAGSQHQVRRRWRIQRGPGFLPHFGGPGPQGQRTERPHHRRRSQEPCMIGLPSFYPAQAIAGPHGCVGSSAAAHSAAGRVAGCYCARGSGGRGEPGLAIRRGTRAPACAQRLPGRAGANGHVLPRGAPRHHAAHR